MADVCACHIHDSGRGLVFCLHHSQKQGEHKAMFLLLRQIAHGEVDDPAAAAARLLSDVRYWNRDHPANELPPIERQEDQDA